MSKLGLVLLVLGIAATLIGCLNVLVTGYHIHTNDPTAANNIITHLSKKTDAISTSTTTDKRPPLSTLVDGFNVTGDISWLLDFAIVGFPKCGTSSFMYQLKSHPQVDMFTDERCDLAYNKQAILAADMYVNLSAAPDIHRGLKCPLDLESMPLAIPNYHKYFPRTKFIIGIRHPILWFESFYNFRIHNGAPMPPPELLIGRCKRGWFNVCTFRGNFHIFLANLGKTNILEDPQQLQYFAPKLQRSIKPQVLAQEHGRRPVFLYEVSQLSDERQVPQLLKDLQHFLGLSQPFADTTNMLWFRPGVKHDNEKHLAELNKLKMDICQGKYLDLRRVLLQQATNASQWISKYFLEAPNVRVSFKENFLTNIMPSWRRDPCVQGRPPKTHA